MQHLCHESSAALAQHGPTKTANRQLRSSLFTVVKPGSCVMLSPAVILVKAAVCTAQLLKEVSSAGCKTKDTISSCSRDAVRRRGVTTEAATVSDTLHQITCESVVRACFLQQPAQPVAINVSASRDLGGFFLNHHIPRQRQHKQHKPKAVLQIATSKALIGFQCPGIFSSG